MPTDLDPGGFSRPQSQLLSYEVGDMACSKMHNTQWHAEVSSGDHPPAAVHVQTL